MTEEEELLILIRVLHGSVELIFRQLGSIISLYSKDRIFTSYYMMH